MYLYGDLSPFPFDHHFFETLLSLTDTVVSLLKIDASCQCLRVKYHKAQRYLQEKEEWFEELKHKVKTAKKGKKLGSITNIERDLERLADHVFECIDEGHLMFSLRVELLKNKLDQALAQERQRIFPTLEAFFLRHEIPHTRWSISWNSLFFPDEQAKGEAWAFLPPDLQVAYDLNLSENALWAGAVPVKCLTDVLRFELPRIDGDLTLDQFQLEEDYLTKVILSPYEQSIEVRRSPEGQAPGFQLSKSLADGSLIIRLVGQSDAVNAVFRLNSAHVEGLERLYKHLERELYPLVQRRHQVRGIWFAGIPLEQLESTTALAEVMIASVAAEVRALLSRSQGSQEISIKLRMPNNRRLEFFLPLQLLQERICHLPLSLRKYFESFGVNFRRKYHKVATPEKSIDDTPRIAAQLVSLDDYRRSLKVEARRKRGSALADAKR